MKTTIWTLAAITLLISSCSEKIDLSLDASEKHLVIEGSITNDLKHHSVKITQSTEYFYNQAAPVVSGAMVTVSDGSQEFIYVQKQPGLYESLDEFQGIPGRTYTLTVRYDGKEYKASSIMTAAPALDSIELEFALMPLDPGVIWEPNKTYYNILIYAQEPGEYQNFYMFDALKNDSMLTNKITEKKFAADFAYNGAYLKGIKALQVQAQKGDTITFLLSSIDKAYYQFLTGLQISAMNGSPFVGPPANAKGNVSNGAFGFFYTSATNRKITVVR